MSIVVPNLAALKAADTTNISMIFDGVIFTWTSGNFTGQADDDSIVQSDNESLSIGAWVRQASTGITYRHANPDSTLQTMADTVRRERLNLYDKIPKALWPAIEAGTNIADLTAYVVSALGTSRGINVPAGTFRMALNVNWESFGQSLRGEGRHLTYFENVDASPVITLDSSDAHIFGFELEDMWVRNRDPATFTACDLLKITGAGDGEIYQNDKHHFRRLWFYQGRDNIACFLRELIGVDVKVNLIRSSDGLLSAANISSSARNLEITSREVPNKLYGNEHSEVFVERVHVSDGEETLCGKVNKLLFYASPLSGDGIAGIKIEFKCMLGYIFICGADMPFTLAVSFGDTIIGTSEFPIGEYTKLFKIE